MLLRPEVPLHGGSNVGIEPYFDGPMFDHCHAAHSVIWLHWADSASVAVGLGIICFVLILIVVDRSKLVDQVTGENK